MFAYFIEKKQQTVKRKTITVSEDRQTFNKLQTCRQQVTEPDSSAELMNHYECRGCHAFVLHAAALFN